MFFPITGLCLYWIFILKSYFNLGFSGFFFFFRCILVLAVPVHQFLHFIRIHNVWEKYYPQTGREKNEGLCPIDKYSFCKKKPKHKTSCLAVLVF